MSSDYAATMKALLALLLCSTFIYAVPINKNQNQKSGCGYQSCPQVTSETLNVHLVPHSHDDVGWLKTVDQYYWGARNSIQRAGVQYIISSVVEALKQNPERRFIQVESAFFYKWWQEQSNDVKEQFRELVENGQLEIVGGAWSMNDEAATHYHSIIDQFTLGLRTVNDTLGECGRPKIGWQIDPFGHSKEMASIFSQMGYEALFFSRLDWRDKSERLSTKTPEILWQGSESLGDDSNIFTSVLYNHYSAPSGYCFDILCTNDPIVDDISSPEYNYKEKIEGFADFIKNQAQHYTTSNIIITMGDDFNYQDALSYYLNMDKLVKGFKDIPQYYNNKQINLFYSTPSCYVKAVNDEASASQISFKKKTDDFFPYASDPHAYWTGYYTSRPTSKRFERQGNNLLQIAKQISSFALDENTESELQSLRDAMGIMQHHDAITGTEKQHVADDYHRILTMAFEQTTKRVNDLLSVLLPMSGSSAINIDLQSCLQANVSVCDLTTDGEFIAAIYNPLSRSISSYVRLPVRDEDHDVEGPDGSKIDFQIVPPIDEFGFMTEAPVQKYDLLFKADDIPPLGLKIYKVTKSTTKKSVTKKVEDSKEKYVVGDEQNGFEIDSTTNLLKSITLNGNKLSLSQELMYYIGAVGDNSAFEKRASGAYIFRPDPEYPNALHFPNDKITIETYKGDLVEEVHQVFSSWAKQIIRLYKGENHIEVDWLIGNIDVDDNLPKEVISRFQVDLNNGDTFYTDSNGREMVKRIRDHRATYPLGDIGEAVAGNYYPVTSRITLKDEEKNLEFGVLNDRAQGGGSLASGQVELMLHRRLLRDDAFGVGEALDEVQYGVGLYARGQLYITLGPITPSDGSASSTATQVDLAQRKLLSPWPFISSNVNLWSSLQKQWSGVKRSLPNNVQILTLEPWKSSENTLLLRLEHVYAANSDSELAKPVTVDLQDLFTTLEITSIQEMTLAGNQLLDENERFSWIIGGNLEDANRNSKDIKHVYTRAMSGLRDPAITLKPMQIRTFVVTI